MVMSTVISDSWVEVIEERNSVGGKAFVPTEEDCNSNCRRFLKVRVLYFRSVGVPWNQGEQTTLIRTDGEGSPSFSDQIYQKFPDGRRI